MLQSYTRGFLIRHQIEAEKRRQNEILASLTIQRTFRGYKTRQKVYIWHHAAITIQRTFRGFKTRKCLHRLQHAAVTVQRHVRGHLAHKR